MKDFIHKVTGKIPRPIKKALHPITSKLLSKHGSELSFWRNQFSAEKGIFANDHYQRFMLAMAGERDDMFLKDKVVADFGCGPRGSLHWIQSTSFKIGIDVLADRYADEFTANIVTHDMVYLKCTEKIIPLPSNFVDIMFTFNALDHVDNFSRMCAEILRVLRPGGELIGSFNLEEPPTACEPQTLSEAVILKNLLQFMNVQSYRITKKGGAEDPYAALFNGNLSYEKGDVGILWVRAKKI